MDYTVILKVPGDWSDIFVASVRHESHPHDSRWTVHNAIVALAKKQFKELNPTMRTDRVKVLLTLKGPSEVMYFGFETGVN